MIRKILIVDDNQEILSLMGKKLIENGYVVNIVQEGQQVLAKAKIFRPDCILMDIVLPDMDGPEIVRLLQQDQDLKNIRVLFISGLVTGDTQSSPLVRVGSTLYLAIAKPFTIQALVDRIRTLSDA